jgi:site-specific recombinase XerD
MDGTLEEAPGATALPLTHHASRITHHVTIAEAVERFLGDLRRSPRTVATYRRGLDKFLAYLAAQGLDPAVAPVTALTIDHVVGYVTDSAPRAARRPEQVAALRTLRTYLAAVRRFYASLAAFDRRPALATDTLSTRLRAVLGRFAPPPPSVRTRDLDRLMGYVASLPAQAEPARELHRLKVAALVATLRSAGLRVSELCALRRQEIDLEAGSISVARGRDGKSRVVRLDNAAAAALVAYWRARGDAELGRVGALPAFSGRDAVGRPGAPISPRTVQALVARLGRAAGLETTITPHSFRHGLATELVRRRVRESVVQRLLGHASPATTQLYVHLVDQEILEE